MYGDSAVDSLEKWNAKPSSRIAMGTTHQHKQRTAEGKGQDDGTASLDRHNRGEIATITQYRIFAQMRVNTNAQRR